MKPCDLMTTISTGTAKTTVLAKGMETVKVIPVVNTTTEAVKTTGAMMVTGTVEGAMNTMRPPADTLHRSTEESVTPTEIWTGSPIVVDSHPRHAIPATVHPLLVTQNNGNPLKIVRRAKPWLCRLAPTEFKQPNVLFNAKSVSLIKTVRLFVRNRETHFDVLRTPTTAALKEAHVTFFIPSLIVTPLKDVTNMTRITGVKVMRTGTTVVLVTAKNVRIGALVVIGVIGMMVATGVANVSNTRASGMMTKRENLTSLPGPRTGR